MDVWVALNFHITHRKTLSNVRASNAEEILQTDKWFMYINKVYTLWSELDFIRA